MKKLIYFSLIVFFGISFYACSGTSEEQAEEETPNESIKITSEQFKTAGMELGLIESKTFYNTISSNGYIEVKPNGKASVSIALGGLVSDIKVKLGDPIKKGQLLFTLENLEFIQLQQDYLETSAKLETLLGNYKRQELFLEEKVGSEKDYLQAKSEYLVMQAMHLGLKQKLKLINIQPSELEGGKISSVMKILAPISGSLTELNFSIGDYVNPGDKAMEIINTDQLQLVLSVFERDVLEVEERQDVTFQLPELIDYEFQAKVLTVGKKISENNGSVTVYCEINPSNNKRLIPGMFVKANIITSEYDKPAMYESAVIELDNQMYILVLNKLENEVYHFTKTLVQTGLSYNTNVEIKNTNLNPDQQVLIKGAFNVLN